MFNTLQLPADWSTIKKLIWLRGEPIWSGGGEEMTASGATPLTITNALHKPMLKCETNILPVQDFHGYDAPWPAGGGANKFDAITWVTLGQNTAYYTASSDETITVDHEDVSGISNRLFDVESGETYSYRTTFASMRIFDSSAATIASTSTGTFTAPEDGKIAVKFYGASYPASGKFILAKGSTVPSAWSPYSNICPIVGWDGAEVYVGSANIWDEEWESGKINTAGNTVDATCIRSKNYIPVISGNTYYVKTNSQVTIYGYDADKNVIINVWNGFSTTQKLNANLAIPDSVRYIRFFLTGTTYNHDIAINYPSSVTTYNPHSASTSSVTFDSTVYGGSYEFVGGQGSVTWDVIDLGDLSWGVYTVAGSKEIQSGYSDIFDRSEAVTLMCEQYKAVTNTNQTGLLAAGDNTICVVRGGSRPYIGIVDHRFDNSTGSEVKAALTGIKLAYIKTTPTPFTADGADIKTFKGTNYVWTDCGNAMEVTYIGKTE